jgi:hypothetical protein
MSNIVIQGFPSNGAYTRSDILGYKSYVAILNQTGIDAPVANVLYNDIGLVTWNYAGVGQYTGSCPSFDETKMTVQLSQNANWGAVTTAANMDSNEIYITTYDLPSTFDNYSDDVLYKSYIEVRLYP